MASIHVRVLEVFPTHERWGDPSSVAVLRRVETPSSPDFPPTLRMPGPARTLAPPFKAEGEFTTLHA